MYAGGTLPVSWQCSHFGAFPSPAPNGTILTLGTDSGIQPRSATPVPQCQILPPSETHWLFSVQGRRPSRLPGAPLAPQKACRDPLLSSPTFRDGLQPQSPHNTVDRAEHLEFPGGRWREWAGRHMRRRNLEEFSLGPALVKSWEGGTTFPTIPCASLLGYGDHDGSSLWGVSAANPPLRTALTTACCALFVNNACSGAGFPSPSASSSDRLLCF